MGFLFSFLIGLAAFLVAGWWFYRRVQDSPDSKSLWVKWVITFACFLLWVYLGIQAQGSGAGGAFLIPAIGACTGILLSVLWTPHIAGWLFSPITSWYDGGDREPELRPLYSIAQAQRNRGNYDRAIAEVRKQLARFPNDYQGYMLIAEIQAEDFKDLDTAQQTIEHILTIPELAPKNAAFALTRLADWQVKFRDDLSGARETFQRIIERLPETEEAQLAAQRIAHLASPEDLADMHNPRAIRVTVHTEKIGLQGRVVGEPEPAETMHSIAQRYVDHLRDYPLDNDIREKLALLYANEYQRLDLAMIELEQLIATPHQLPKVVAHALNTLADLQIRLASDVNGARKTLERIVVLYPNSAAANTAQTRISQLRLELNQHSNQKTLRLGSYEQNIGLKRMNSSGAEERGEP